jgi:predicted phage-related endonuclease
MDLVVQRIVECEKFKKTEITEKLKAMYGNNYGLIQEIQDNIRSVIKITEELREINKMLDKML